MMVERAEAIRKMDDLSLSRTPFFFFTDFLGERAFIAELNNRPHTAFQFDFDKGQRSTSDEKIMFSKEPISYNTYAKAFDQVVGEINIGNSFLVNLTFRTPIQTSLTLAEIYDRSVGKYKMLFEDQFVCFSPETFVKIIGEEIYSYPMKGTIDASLSNAREQLLNDPKEVAEHVTIVDLIRNDLSIVAQDVALTKFRFLSEIKTQDKDLLQVSSEIKGTISSEYKNKLGTLLFKLLPAGSISGAPKQSTVDIIENSEACERGFYTGVCGHFDGTNLDSGVMIRFIENRSGQLYYRSGGGITSFSKSSSEYQEMVDKVYLPI